MLRHLGETDAADRTQAALEHVFEEQRHTTRDVGGTAGTSEFTDAVIEQLLVASA